jgi:hypothetical protein
MHLLLLFITQMTDAIKSQFEMNSIFKIVKNLSLLED